MIVTEILPLEYPEVTDTERLLLEQQRATEQRNRENLRAFYRKVYGPEVGDTMALLDELRDSGIPVKGIA